MEIQVRKQERGLMWLTVGFIVGGGQDLVVLECHFILNAMCSYQNKFKAKIRYSQFYLQEDKSSKYLQI